jgi:hypothetical protein
MASLIRICVFISIFLLFMVNGPLLDLVGWTYSTSGGSVVSKVHPALLLLMPAAFLGLLSNDPRFRTILKRPWFALYVVAAVVITVRAVTNQGGIAGQLPAAVVTFLLPAILMVAIQGLNRRQWDAVGMALRVFFVINSLMALTERMIGARLIPSFLDTAGNVRAAALLGHPLNGALLTGLLIVFLASARPKLGERVALRLPEILLHVGALFAFGGRSSLVFTTAVVLASGIIVWRSRTQRQMTPLQRAIPFLIIAIGICFVFLPIPFIEATLERFQGDSSSTEVRNASLNMLNGVTGHDILYGLSEERKEILLDFFNAPVIEISWIAIMLTYGLVPAVLIIVGLVALMIGVAKSLDRSAMWMTLLFGIVSIGSLAIGGKSLLIAQSLIMMYALSQPRLREDGADIFRTISAASRNVSARAAG